MSFAAAPTSDEPVSATDPSDPADPTHPRRGTGPLALAGLASLAAGAIHAAAIGVHAEHQAAARTFAVLAVAQIAWGVVALVARRRSLALLGLAINGAALVGWTLAKTQGISFIDGLGEAESIQWPDALAAVAAGLAVIGAARGLLVGPTARSLPRPALGVVGVVFAAMSLLAMTQTASHAHTGTDDHGSSEPAHGHDEVAAADSSAADASAATDDADHGDEADHVDPEVAAAVAKPYDPDKPIDLGGVAGVTETQQARAENLIAVTLADLPRYADPAAAEADGFHSIGDAFTGYEHYINWDYVTDDSELDPDRPESLVYRAEGGERKLVSAMFMLSPGATLDDVPELGGNLTQWHIHDDLCFSDDPEAPRVAGVTSVGGDCRPPLVKLEPVPMIHVWIVPHECGPFSALEGVGAGQVAEGEEQLCDSAHGHGA